MANGLTDPNGTAALLTRSDAPARTGASFAPLTFLSILGFAATVVFVSFPQIDIAAAKLFYTSEDRFIAELHPFVRIMKRAMSYFGFISAAFVIVGLLVVETRKTPFFGMASLDLRFLFYALLIGPLLIVNLLLKSYWGRARPNDVELFGGTQVFTPAVMVADQCPTNCSFVSGDVSMAFTVLAFAIAWGYRGRATVLLSVAFALFIGMVRMSNGSHFISDVTFAIIFTGLAIYAADVLVYGRAWRIEARVFAACRAGIAASVGQVIALWTYGRTKAPAWRAQAAAMMRPAPPEGAGDASGDRDAPNDPDAPDDPGDRSPPKSRPGIGAIGKMLWLFFFSRPTDFPPTEKKAAPDQTG